MNRSKKKKQTKSRPDPIDVKGQTTPKVDDRTDRHETPVITAKEPDSAIRILLGVVAVSLLSVPICYFLSYLQQMKNSLNVFLFSVVICASVAPLTYFLLIKQLLHVKKETYVYVFAIFSFTAVADLVLALTIDEYSSAFLFYLEQGEVYLKTAHGLFINYWDGTAHLILYLTMLYCMLKRRTETKFYRFLSLFWSGSILNSLLVLLGGAAVGRYGTHIKPSYLLNIPYALFPLIFALRQFRSRDSFIEQQKRSYSKARRLQPLISRPVDLFFIAYLLFATVFSIYRALLVLHTPMMKRSNYYHYEPYILNTSGFPLVQLLTYAFYFVPFYCAAIRALLFHDQQPSQYRWFPDWTMIHAGAAAQAQFSYLLSSLHNPPLFPDPSWSPVPSQYRLITLNFNTILAIVPQLLAVRVSTCSDHKDFY